MARAQLEPIRLKSSRPRLKLSRPQLKSSRRPPASGPIVKGMEVRVRDGVNPRFGWHEVSPGDVGVVTSIVGDVCEINFPARSGWAGMVKEMEPAKAGHAAGRQAQIIQVGALEAAELKLSRHPPEPSTRLQGAEEGTIAHRDGRLRGCIGMLLTHANDAPISRLQEWRSKSQDPRQFERLWSCCTTLKLQFRPEGVAEPSQGLWRYLFARDDYLRARNLDPRLTGKQLNTGKKLNPKRASPQPPQPAPAVLEGTGSQEGQGDHQQ
eukprot:gene17107-biopygen5940